MSVLHWEATSTTHVRAQRLQPWRNAAHGRIRRLSSSGARNAQRATTCTRPARPGPIYVGYTAGVVVCRQSFIALRPDPVFFALATKPGKSKARHPFTLFTAVLYSLVEKLEQSHCNGVQSTAQLCRRRHLTPTTRVFARPVKLFRIRCFHAIIFNLRLLPSGSVCVTVCTAPVPVGARGALSRRS
jgi:hypothetical protein